MFGSSAALKTVQLENAQLRMELDQLKKLVEAITQDAVTQQEISGLVSEAVQEAMQDMDIEREVESAVENVLDRASISVRF